MMNKLISLILCLCTFQISFAQSEKANIKGAIKISNSDSQNPAEGTIRWTGQDFEGFDGTEWKSLTCCVDGESSDAILSCPSNFVLDNCSLTVNWTHDNPLSSTVNYDLKINGVDPGPSVTHPISSNTIDICSALGITTGSGTLNIELLYWYDGDLNTILSAGTCTVNYDFGGPSGNVFTFAQIRAAGRSANGYGDAGIDYADAHLAELLYMNPDMCNWNVDAANELITILPCEEPTGSIAYLPAPSGGNDANMIENFISANAGKSVVGTGDIYQLSNTVDINVPVKIFDVPTRMTGSIGIAYGVNSADVEFHNCPIDANNSATLLTGWNVAAIAHRFVLTRSGVKDMFRIGDGPAAAVRLRGGRDFKISCNRFENLLLQTNPSSSGSTIMRAVWSANSAPGALSPGGYIANNYVNNLHTNRKPSGTTDPEFFAVQSYDGTAGRVKIIANRCVNAGKRMVKCQVGNVFAASNFYHWKDLNGPLGDRIQSTVVSIQLRSNHVRAINNRIKLEGNGKYVDSFRANVSTGDHIFEELHFDYNDIECIDAPESIHHGHGIAYYNSDSSSADSHNQLTNCSARGNVFRGSGGTNHVFYFGPGFDDDASSLDIDISGNTVTTPILISVFRGSNSTPLPN